MTKISPELKIVVLTLGHLNIYQFQNTDLRNCTPKTFVNATELKS